MDKGKNLNIFFLGFYLIFLAGILSCAKDDDQKTEETEIEEETEITITVEDLTLNIDEHPEDGYILGAVEAETNIGTLSFSLIEQNPTDALSLILKRILKLLL